MVLYTSDDSYLDVDTKHYIDYLVCVAILIWWIRWTLYFLMKKSFSILLLTLVAILFDTGAFLICLVWYIFIMASIFTTLYQDILPGNYGNLIVSFRTMFDAGLTVYSYSGMESRVYDHSLLLIFHVYTMNILLLNYLIGILSTTYENMQQSGIFKYKVNLYNYWERYMNAYKEKGLGELVLHPPPISSLSILMIPFIPFKKGIRCISYCFSIIMYWCENLIFLMSFLLYEILVLPVTYSKVYLNIIRASIGLYTKIFFVGMWIFLGNMILSLYIGNNLSLILSK